MNRLILLAVAALLLLAPGCNKDAIDQASEPTDKYDANHYIRLAESLLAEGAEEVEYRGATVTVPAGSVDAIEDAVNQAGQGGTVILESGLHTEDATVVINYKVKITGQPGAIVEFETGDETVGFPYVSNPGFHILGASNVIIENLYIRDANESGPTGILIEGSNQTRIRGNTLEYFELGIAQYGSDNTQVYNNVITGVLSFGGVGVLNVVGNNMKIYFNTISNNNLDIFVGDRGGLIMSNHFNSTGATGLLLCTPNIGGVYLVLPSGQTVAADESANRWLVLRNYSENHAWNYLVIDNANNNTLVNNDGDNALLSDIEMAGDSFRFGFFTPTSFGNLAISSAYPDITIKVCGVDNEAVGGTLIDTNQFPCD
ncbi:MAG: right-handed parallel beta-helix repeat-containing protein [Phaeodactylibacter sp.]|nr:right-handed parallel beta-helix repeat-containing protein [Phaeodactylibacter sp.]MCB9304044.1 right-handed parallel beta-helix repeat-containing protein [Lewinellaceae bacterium]